VTAATSIVKRNDGYALVLKQDRTLCPRKYEPHVSRIGGQSGGLGRGGHTRDFWSKVKVCGESPGACWEWIGYRDRDGYGKMTTVIDGRVRTVRPHRFLYEQERGPIPAGMNLLHGCDNRACVNPWHTRPGTQRENIHDMIWKGRKAQAPDNRGELSPRAILTEEDVLFIRSQAAAYGLVPVLARLFGTSHECIVAVRSRKSWRHIGNGNAQNAMPLHQLRALAEQRDADRFDLDDAAISRPGAE
jgi:hypothetical protein